MCIELKAFLLGEYGTACHRAILWYTFHGHIKKYLLLTVIIRKVSFCTRYDSKFTNFPFVSTSRYESKAKYPPLATIITSNGSLEKCHDAARNKSSLTGACIMSTIMTTAADWQHGCGCYSTTYGETAVAVAPHDALYHIHDVLFLSVD